MGVGMGCLYACAPLTLIASILLFMIAVMLRSGNWTFEVLAAKNDWDRKAKSNACRNGGVIYICISIVLWILVLLDSFVLHLEKVPDFVATLWREKRLPRWREIRRSYHNHHKITSRANPAVDVVVTALTAAPAVLQGDSTSQQFGAEAEGFTGQSPASGAPPQAMSPLTGQANPLPHDAPAASTA